MRSRAPSTPMRIACRATRLLAGGRDRLWGRSSPAWRSPAGSRSSSGRPPSAAASMAGPRRPRRNRRRWPRRPEPPARAPRPNPRPLSPRPRRCPPRHRARRRCPPRPRPVPGRKDSGGDPDRAAVCISDATAGERSGHPGHAADHRAHRHVGGDRSPRLLTALELGRSHVERPGSPRSGLGGHAGGRLRVGDLPRAGPGVAYIVYQGEDHMRGSCPRKRARRTPRTPARARRRWDRSR